MPADFVRTPPRGDVGLAELLLVIERSPTARRGLGRQLGIELAELDEELVDDAEAETTGVDEHEGQDIESTPDRTGLQTSLVESQVVGLSPTVEEPVVEGERDELDWRMHRVRSIARIAGELDEPSAPRYERAAPPRRGRVPVPHLLCPWSHLWPRIEAALGRATPTREPDVDRLVPSLASGEFIGEIPWRRHRRLPAAVDLVIDGRPELRPLRDDQRAVALALRSRLGASRVRLRWVREDRGYWPDDVTRSVLVLGDPARFGDPASRARWTYVEARLRDQQAPVAMLSPAASGAESRPAIPRIRWDLEPSRARRSKSMARAGLVRRLLGWASLTTRVETGLLRALRSSLIPELDAGGELEAWNSNVFQGAWADVAVIDAERRETLRAEVLEDAEVHEFELALRCILAWHAGLPYRVLAEELVLVSSWIERRGLTLCDELQAEVDSARAYLLGEVEALARQEWADVEDLRWGRRVVLRARDGLARDAGVGGILRKVYVGAEREFPSDQEAPQWLGLRPKDFGNEEEAGASVSEWTLWQVGHELVLAPSGQRPGGDASPVGTRLADLPLGYRRIIVESESGSGGALASPWRDVGAEPLELGARVTAIETDLVRVELVSEALPAWADGVHVDAEGTFAEVELDDGVYRFRWELVARGLLRVGQWRSESCPGWAERLGVDEYGVYADFEVKGVRQRMRWCGPTVFLMGSPETEDRYGGFDWDETQHEVELTQGYWLADTACSEELWEAGDGDVRDRSGSERPVRSVSWDDVKEWIGRLNFGDGDGFRLPSEAEWENACRAGTQTAFAFGDELSRERACFGLSYTSDEPADVKHFTPNRWGLHQMHGNIWEWCEDWLGNYTLERSVNPSGPPSGGVRVLRGGSWDDPAVSCRSAQRDGNPPGLRLRSCGFRLARGRTRSQPAAGGKPAPSKPDSADQAWGGRPLSAGWRRVMKVFRREDE